MSLVITMQIAHALLYNSAKQTLHQLNLSRSYGVWERHRKYPRVKYSERQEGGNKHFTQQKVSKKSVYQRIGMNKNNFFQNGRSPVEGQMVNFCFQFISFSSYFHLSHNTKKKKNLQRQECFST